MKTDFKFFLWAPLFAVLLAPPCLGTAQAQYAEIDEGFLDRHVPELRFLVETALETASTQEDYFAAARQLLVIRGQALGELNLTRPLTTFDGIETQDAYDRDVVLGLAQIVDAGVKADTTLPPEQHASIFYQVMGDVPQLGEVPVAFMVLGMSNIAMITADTLAVRGALPPASITKLTLRRIQHATGIYSTRLGDMIAENNADNFRHSSVIGRMRCSKDQSPYRIGNMKNKIGADDSISTVYFLECEVCHEPKVIRFNLVLPSRLNQVADRQKLKKKPRPVRPSEGLDP